MKNIKRIITTSFITGMLQTYDNLEAKEVSVTTTQTIKTFNQAIKIAKKELKLDKKDSFIILDVKQEVEEYYMEENYFLKQATVKLIKTTHLQGE